MISFALDMMQIKKGKRFFILLPFFILLCSCDEKFKKYGHLSFYQYGDNRAFVFSVSDEFLIKNKNSTLSKDKSKITEAELGLLKDLLKVGKNCLNENGEPHFLIRSRQEKIFDITFAHLIEKNYKAKALTPLMYFGLCL